VAIVKYCAYCYAFSMLIEKQCDDRFDIFFYNLSEMNVESLTHLLNVVNQCSDCDGCEGQANYLKKLIAERGAES